MMQAQVMKYSSNPLKGAIKVSSNRSKHRPRKLHFLRWIPNVWVTTSGPHRRPALYLSFDDGPNPVNTPPLLDLLAEHGIRATFFLIGNHVESNEALARRIVSEGHMLGNHSYSHPHFERLSLEEQLAEVERTDRILSAVDGKPHHAFRPPRGVLPRRMLINFLLARHPIAYWSYDSLDYSKRSAEELVALARINPPRTGDIILMHDDSGIALEMLKMLIPEWKAQGFSFGVLPQAAAYRQ